MDSINYNKMMHKKITKQLITFIYTNEHNNTTTTNLNKHINYRTLLAPRILITFKRDLNFVNPYTKRIVFINRNNIPVTVIYRLRQTITVLLKSINQLKKIL